MVLVQKISRVSPLLRAVLVIGTVAALVTGVTFAALQNTATLTNNTINSNVDGLLLDSDGNDTFALSDDGFPFANIAPGDTSDAKTFKLKNSTDEALDVNVQIINEEALPAGVDPTDIVFIFDVPGGTSEDVSADWGDLTATNGVQLINDLAAGAEATVTVKVHIDESVPADTSITPFDFEFGSPEAV